MVLPVLRRRPRGCPPRHAQRRPAIRASRATGRRLPARGLSPDALDANPLGFLLDIILGVTLLKFDNPNAVFSDLRRPRVNFTSFSFHRRNCRSRSSFSTRSASWPCSPSTSGAMGLARAVQRTGVPESPREGWPRVTGVHRPGHDPQAVVDSDRTGGGGRVYKDYGPHDKHEGFPTYFTFLVSGRLALSQHSAVQVNPTVHQLAGRQLHRGVLGGIDQHFLGSHAGRTVRDRWATNRGT